MNEPKDFENGSSNNISDWAYPAMDITKIVNIDKNNFFMRKFISFYTITLN